jgi:hypothetical protein
LIGNLRRESGYGPNAKSSRALKLAAYRAEPEVDGRSSLPQTLLTTVDELIEWLCNLLRCMSLFL